MSTRHTRLDQRRWAITRRQVFERDGWRCRHCGRPGRLECDHVVPLHVRPDGADPYDIDGLQALCRGCHIAKTKAEITAIAAKAYPKAAAWKRAVEELM